MIDFSIWSSIVFAPERTVSKSIEKNIIVPDFCS